MSECALVLTFVKLSCLFQSVNCSPEGKALRLSFISIKLHRLPFLFFTLLL